MAVRNQVLSLFGATPEQIRQRQLESERDFLAQMQRDPYQSAGAAIGVGLSRLFGGKSKELQEAEQRQETLQGMDELGAMAEAEAAQRGMAPLSMNPVNLLTRKANELDSVATAFRNLGQDTTELENAALTTRLEALKAQEQQEIANLERQKLEAELSKLNNPVGLSLEEAGKLAKDFTPASVKEAMSANDVSLLQYKENPAGNYVIMNQQVGVDRNGQPIMKNILVDKEQVGQLSGNAPVVSMSQLQIPSAQGASQPSVEAQQPTVPSQGQQEATELPGVSGLSPEKNIEMRSETLENVRAASSLIEDVFNPSFDDVVGRTNILTREAATTTGSELAPLVGRVTKGSKERGIAIAKQLGVNPTDKDLQVAIESAPTANDPSNVWQDWLENTYVPRLFLALDSRYGADNPQAQQYKTEISERLLAAQASAEVPTRTATTSSGTTYTVRSK